MKKCIAFFGDSHVHYLGSIYSSSYHESEINFIGLSGLRLPVGKIGLSRKICRDSLKL